MIVLVYLHGDYVGSVRYNGGFLPDILYCWPDATTIGEPNQSHQEFWPLQSMFSPERFDILPPLVGWVLTSLRWVQFFLNPSVSTPPILSVSRLYSLFSILCTLYSVLCTNSGSGKRAEYKERRHPLQYGPADKNVPIKKFRRESWTHSPAHGSDQVSCAGDVRASGTRRAVVEVWGTAATWFGLVRGGVITRRAQSAGACP